MSDSDAKVGQDFAHEDLSNSVTYEVVEDHICLISLNREDRRNAVAIPGMNDLLHEHFERAQDDDNVKVIILRANGPDFCAGEDTRKTPIESMGLKKGSRLPQSVRMRNMRHTYETLQRGMIWGDKVTIAACQGNVMGLGMSLALACDMMVCSDNARFARRQSRIGFGAFDGQLPIALLKMGLNRGMEIQLTGRSVYAAEMKEWGIANSVVPADQLDDEAMRFARAVAALSTDGLMLSKRAMHAHLHNLGIAAFQNFASIGHPLFTNIVWREDEFNFLNERNKAGDNKTVWKKLNKIFKDLGFD